MSDKVLSQIILVEDACGAVQQLVTLQDAIEFLEQWPPSEHDVVHQISLQACIAAHDDLKPVEVASAAVRSFAKRKGLLATGPEAAPSAHAAGAPFPHAAH